MVFLREGGKDELSILLEHGRTSKKPLTTASATREDVLDRKGKGRATDISNDDAHVAANSSKTKAEPTDSLLHRLAGPSTGKAGLKRE